MGKIITFINDVNHNNVEELSNTYNSAIFFSTNETTSYTDIYTDSYLYSYIQGVNNDKNTVTFRSGQFKLKYEDDKLKLSYIYFVDKEITMYPLPLSSYGNDYFTSQNEYRFNVNHSSDINIDMNKFSYDHETFVLNYESNSYILKFKDEKLDSLKKFITTYSSNQNHYTTIKPHYTLEYNIDGTNSIYTDINVIVNTPKLTTINNTNEANIILSNKSSINPTYIPYSLSDNQNHSRITLINDTSENVTVNYSIDDNATYTRNVNANKETKYNSYTYFTKQIRGFSNTRSKVNYTYVTIEPKVKAKSMAIINSNPSQNNHLNHTLIMSEIIPYESQFKNAITGGSNIFKIRFYPNEPTHKNVEWYSTDESTMKIEESTNEYVKVRYYKPGKVILYAIHSNVDNNVSNNDNELRALMTITISGNTLVTAIEYIKVIKALDNTDEISNIIDGDPMLFKIKHQPIDSEISLVFENDGENYIDENRILISKYSNTNDTWARSYIQTYANVKNWGDEAFKNPKFCLSYNDVNNNQLNYTYSNRYNIYKIYSEHDQTYAYVNRNNEYVCSEKNVYIGDKIKTISYFTYQPTLLNLSNFTSGENAVSYAIISYSSDILSTNDIISVENSHINLTSNNKIQLTSGEIDTEQIRKNENNENIIYSEFSYQYNHLKKLTGNNSYIIKLYEPSLTISDLKNVSYGYTGAFASYTINPNYATINSIDNGIECENNKLKFTNGAPNSKQNILAKYKIKNNNHIGNELTIKIYIVPVEMEVLYNNSTITNNLITFEIDIDNDNLTKEFSYRFKNTSNMVFDENCTCTVNNDHVTLTGNTFTLTHTAGAFTDNKDTKHIIITNTVSGCKYEFDVIFTLNAIYITDFKYTIIGDLYYNCNGNDIYKNNSILNFGNTQFTNNDNNAPTTNITLQYDTACININGSNNITDTNISDIAINAENKDIPYHIHARNKFVNQEIEFTYKNSNGNNVNKTVLLTSYALPDGANLSFNYNKSYIYENTNVGYVLNISKKDEMKNDMKNICYFVNIDNSKLTTSNSKFILKNYNTKSNYPVIKYTNTYGILGQYSNTGQDILYDYSLYGIYTYFSYNCDNVYAGLHTNPKFTINAYMNPTNINKVYYNTNLTSELSLSKTAENYFNISYDGKTFTNAGKYLTYNINVNQTAYNNSLEFSISYNSTTYLNGIIPKFNPSISLNNTPVITYTNGDDNSNYKKSFEFSYTKSNWPANYNGTWSYHLDNNVISINNSKCKPTENGQHEFKIKCDDLYSTSKSITTHTLCDKFELDSYIPIIVTDGYPYTVNNTIINVTSNNSGKNITCVPTYNISSYNNTYFNKDNNTSLSYKNITNNDGTSITISYSSGIYSNLSTQYTAYAINFGMTYMSMMRKTTANLLNYAYVEGINDPNENNHFEFTNQNEYITSNILSFMNVGTEQINSTIDVNIKYKYPADNGKEYIFEKTQSVKILPYRNLNNMSLEIGSFDNFSSLFDNTTDNQIDYNNHGYNLILRKDNTENINVTVSNQSIELFKIKNDETTLCNVKLKSGSSFNINNNNKLTNVNINIALTNSTVLDFDEDKIGQDNDNTNFRIQFSTDSNGKVLSFSSLPDISLPDTSKNFNLYFKFNNDSSECTTITIDDIFTNLFSIINL